MNTAEINQEFELESNTYGKLTLNQNQIYHFKKGLIGLQQYKDYALFSLEDTPFFIMHHLEEEISFILIPAEKVVTDYEFDLNKESVDLLEANNPEDVVIFLITTISEDAVYVNLKAPVLITPEKQIGCQYVINNKEYPVRHQIVGKGQR